MLPIEDKVERIRALNYVIPILMRRAVLARRAMAAARTGAAFNEAVSRAREADDLVVKYRNELFDLTEAR